MEYVILTGGDVSFINNRAVICAVSDAVVAIFEPIPAEIASYFDGRERVTWVDTETTL